MTDMDEVEHSLNVRVTRTIGSLTVDKSVYTQRCWTSFVEHLGPSHKTKKCPLPHRLVKPDGDFSAKEQRYLNNFLYRSLIEPGPDGEGSSRGATAGE